MEIYRLRTFVVVAREGSITRAAEFLHLSQPAVSAHIKTLEETLGLTLFQRMPIGMSLTDNGRRILARAKATLETYQKLLEEASRIKGHVTGQLRLGVDANSNANVVARLTRVLSDRLPGVEILLQQGATREVVADLLSGRIDAGVYNDVGEPNIRLAVTDLSNFGLYLVGPPGLNASAGRLDWDALAKVPWICPAPDSNCGRAAEKLFQQHSIRPSRIVRVDRESLTRALVTAGIGIGLLHSYSAMEALSSGKVELICEVRPTTRVLFAHLKDRTDELLMSTVASIIPTIGTAAT